jgi:hypothetical protein
MNASTEYQEGVRAEAQHSVSQEAIGAPTWSRWHEIFRVVGYPPYLKRTVRVALIVGSILFSINHLDEVIAGRATAVTWIKGVVTCFVPFCVSNLGVLIASRRPR